MEGLKQAQGTGGTGAAGRWQWWQRSLSPTSQVSNCVFTPCKEEKQRSAASLDKDFTQRSSSILPGHSSHKADLV